jgi:tetratricopeptide (TPR) repeat protein
MSRKRDASFRDVEEALQAIEQFWNWSLPSAFRLLFMHNVQSFFAPCEFFSLEELASGVGRSFGQVPQFLPFGRVAGEESLYGFYLGPYSLTESPPIVYWDESEMFLRPVASDFESFLRHCILTGRYETDDEWPGAAQPDGARLELVRSLLDIPHSLLYDSLPRNDTELYQRLVVIDPQDCVSLCHLGCAARSNGDEERALDFFHRASEAAPWFGDPCYLLADAYRRRENYERAMSGYWSVVQHAVPFCTRTWEWDLGEDHPDADVYEIAADAITQFDDAATAEMKASPLWRVITREDPYDADVRERLAYRLLEAGATAPAERELLTALALCGSAQGKQPDRLYSRLMSLYEQANRRRDAALLAFDRALPHQCR